jgi:glutamate-1-semialdehyde 2,1-aminomutase
LGGQLREGLAEVLDAARAPSQVTGAGSLFCIHLHARPLTDYRSTVPTPVEAGRRAAMAAGLLRGGIVTSPGLMGCLSTPMGDAEIAACLDAFAAALGTLDGGT